MLRRQFIYNSAASIASTFVPLELRLLAQDSQSEASKLARELAQNLVEKKDRPEREDHPAASSLYAPTVESIDTKTGEDVSRKLPEVLGKDHKYFESGDPSLLPPHIVQNYVTESFLEIMVDGHILFAKARIYHHGTSNSFNYSDPRNQLDISFYKNDMTTREMRSMTLSTPLETFTKAREEFGVTFVDKGLSGVATLVRGQGGQQDYISGLKRILSLYEVKK